MLESNHGLTKPIAFTKNGKEKYKTCCGGLATILIFCAMVGYTVVLLTNSFVKETTSTAMTPATGTLDCSSSGGGDDGTTYGPHTYVCDTKTTCPEHSEELCTPVTGEVTASDTLPFLQYNKETTLKMYSSVYNSTEVHYPFMYGFNIAFGWRGNIIDPGSFSVGGLVNYSEDGGSTLGSTVLSMVSCTTDMFPAELADQLTLIGIETYACIDPSHYATLALHQNMQGSNYSILSFDLFKCSSDCVDTTIYGTMFDVLMIDGEFDINDGDGNVKYSINQESEVILDPSAVSYLDLYLDKHLYFHPVTSSISSFYKSHKEGEGYQYYYSNSLLHIDVHLGDMQYFHSTILELQPQVTTHTVSVGDSLAEGETMQDCRWIV
ncbi:unnamed protein product [Moneuplotes crassus]|uniref:Uncharacterized protein n=1 Tax=Euplotes crassus TaxID=5936 RepID=A0AAD1UMI7_EUPCR|nr:unnamed protein product [Moneuplotes crassus]